MVKAITQLGHELDMTVVAEGVENDAQLDSLLNAGVDAVQGFLHTRPMHQEELLSWLLEQKKKDWSADYYSKRK
jgi:cyclic di-GMP phosphodiesterase Gmr